MHRASVPFIPFCLNVIVIVTSPNGWYFSKAPLSVFPYLAKAAAAAEKRLSLIVKTDLCREEKVV